MLITGNGLLDLIDAGVINAAPENVNASSIDITMGDVLMSENTNVGNVPVDMTKKGASINYIKHVMDGTVFPLRPGQCILTSSVEIFNLPNNISAEYKLKSSMARNFLEHLNAGWCDAGWNGSVLTLELKNMTQSHTLALTPGMKIGQVVFYHHDAVPDSMNYANRGQYNGDKAVSESKGMK